MSKTTCNEKVLITGFAGFIGMHLCRSLLQDGYVIHGIDNINTYYEKSLKIDRIKKIKGFSNFSYDIADLKNLNSLNEIFEKFKPDKVVNLAAQAGVQFSIVDPFSYIGSNINGFMNIIDCCRRYKVKGLIYASSSSVYGGNKKVPFSENDNVDNPISIYAATKKSNELMANVYNNLYDLNTTGLRFFTVYGPWGRPDMAYFTFTKKILNNELIEIYDNGKVERDFTYIDDIIKGIRSSIDKNFQNEIFNLGNSKREKVIDLIKIIEKRLSKKAKIKLMPIKPGDVKITNANIDKSKKMLGFRPIVNIEEGINHFIDWYIKYYN